MGHIKTKRASQSRGGNRGRECSISPRFSGWRTEEEMEKHLYHNKLSACSCCSTRQLTSIYVLLLFLVYIVCARPHVCVACVRVCCALCSCPPEEGVGVNTELR